MMMCGVEAWGLWGRNEPDGKDFVDFCVCQGQDFAAAVG